MEEVKNNQGSGLAIGALITGIIAFLMAIIPCVGIMAVIPGVIAVVLGIIGLSRESNNRGMLVGGLVVGIIALMLSLSQGYVVSRFAHHSGSWSKDIEKAMNDIKTEIGDDFDGKNFSIKVTNNKDTIEVKTTTSGHDLEKTLDELEGDTITTVIIKK
ncbi:MAG TPA: hypothetical protein PKH02_03095 [Bacteroidales bacterium]|nr:hypothetical protein [Bacteroidales bacterium]HPT11536.1 hypothetical protein [Bacteroidales bacterium]